MALRGHREVDTEDTDTNLGNFLSLINLQSRHIELLKKRLTSGPRNALISSGSSLPE